MQGKGQELPGVLAQVVAVEKAGQRQMAFLLELVLHTDPPRQPPLLVRQADEQKKDP